MAQTKEQAIARAKVDLSQRLNTPENQITVELIEEADFPDLSLGAAAAGEMSAQMITSGWRMRLNANGKKYEYRADIEQLRLYQFNNKNFLVKLRPESLDLRKS